MCACLHALATRQEGYLIAEFLGILYQKICQGAGGRSSECEEGEGCVSMRPYARFRVAQFAFALYRRMDGLHTHICAHGCMRTSAGARGLKAVKREDCCDVGGVVE